MNLFDFKFSWEWGQKAKLAKSAGISRQYLSDILNCRKRALPELAVKLEAGAKAMGFMLTKENFMFPKEAPDYMFNTPESKKRKKQEHIRRMNDDRTFIYDCSKMLAGLASGKGHRPSKRKPSKRDQRIMDAIAEKASTNPQVIEIVQERILKEMGILIKEQNKTTDTSNRTFESSGVKSGASEKPVVNMNNGRVVFQF